MCSIMLDYYYKAQKTPPRSSYYAAALRLVRHSYLTSVITNPISCGFAWLLTPAAMIAICFP
jgi:hypothetical protein